GLRAWEAEATRRSQRPGWLSRVAPWLSPQGLLWGVITVILAVLVLLPLYHLILESVHTPAGLSLANYAQITQLKRFHEALVNSLLLSLICAVLGMLLGTPLAWLVSRTNVPGRGVIRLCVLGAFVTPGFVNALSWTLLAGPNAGLLNKLWMSLTGASSGLINIFSMPGLVLVSLATIYPLAFLFMYNAFEMLDSEMEEAARTLGARTWRILLTVTLPLARPALIAGFLMMFLETLILYGAPAFIGVPARIYVITTQLWSLFEYPPRIGLAAALSLPLLLVTAVLLWVQRRMLAQRNFATIRGKGGRQQRINLGWWRWPALAGALVVIVLTFVLPNIVLLNASFLRQSFRGFSFANLTLKNYAFVLFSYEAGMLSIRNSLVTSGLAASLAVVLSAIAAYLAERKIVRLGGLLAFLAMLPLVIPGMVFAVGLFAAYSTGPIILYGTLWILFMAYLTKHLPFAFMSCKSALASVHLELESAASILGASRLQVLRDITGPLMKNGLLAGWILVFIPSLKELSASVLLYNSKTTVIPTAIMDAYLLPQWEAVAALSVLLLVINAVVVVVGYRFM
ncbi:MAG TPA: iron ABC transporter permease, partial [Candidatus Saccharimonadia bacterium]|nr:iron ABC transporter permease [Candidatus Saccharimonadia bacterium]